MYGAQDPGNWQSFLKRQDNVGLPIMEAKSKYLMERMNFDNMMNFQSQNHVAGIPANPIVSVAFSGATLATVTGFTSDITVTYTHPVSVSGGTPQLSVANDQTGGGSTTTVDYDYSSGTGTTALVFQYIQATNLNGLLPVGSGKMSTSSTDLANVVQATLTSNTLDAATPSAGTTGVSGVVTVGTGGNTAFEDVVMTIDISADGTVNSALITSVASEATSYFVPGNIVTIDNTEIAGASSGTVVYTLLAGALANDIITSPQAYTMNGAEILTTSVSRPPAVELLAQDSKTSIAS